MPILILGTLLSLGRKRGPEDSGAKALQNNVCSDLTCFFPLDEFEVTSKLKCKSQEVEMHPR